MVCCIHSLVLVVGAGNLASVYYEQGLLDLAIVHYKQALVLDTSFLEAYNNLVCFFFSLYMKYVCALVAQLGFVKMETVKDYLMASPST